MRLLTLGAVPSRWGGRTDGGVAEVHALLAARFAALGEHAGLVAPNRDPAAPAPPAVQVFDPPADAAAQRAWFAALLDRVQPGAVLYFHIAHRFAAWHGQDRPAVPSIGSIHSWTAVHAAPAAERDARLERLRSTMARLDRLVIVSGHCRAEGQALGLDPVSEACVVANPLRPGLAQPISGRGGQARARVVFVGRLEAVKRPHLLLDAAQALDIEAVFLGHGSLRDDLAKRAIARGLDDRVIFRGPFEGTAVAEDLARASLMCVPSMREAFGLAYIEALANGIPVVGYAPAVDEIAAQLGMDVGAGVAGDATAADLIAAIVRVLGQDFDREALSRRTRARFSVSRVTADYRAVISQALSGKRGG